MNLYVSKKGFLRKKKVLRLDVERVLQCHKTLKYTNYISDCELINRIIISSKLSFVDHNGLNSRPTKSVL